MKDGGSTPWKPHLAFHTTPPHPNRGVVWGCGLHASTPLHTTLLKVWNVPHGLSSPTITSGLSRPRAIAYGEERRIRFSRPVCSEQVSASETLPILPGSCVA